MRFPSRRSTFPLRVSNERKNKKRRQELPRYVRKEKRENSSGSEDCVQTEAKGCVFDTPSQSRLSRTYRHSIYIYTHLPGCCWWFEDVTVFRDEEGRGWIRRAESAEQDGEREEEGEKQEDGVREDISRH